MSSKIRSPGGGAIFLLEQLSEARKARAAEGRKQTVDEIVDDPRRRQLTDYLYALSDEARRELIVLTLLGRGDFDHFYERAMETCVRTLLPWNWCGSLACFHRYSSSDFTM
jgi:Protein of unknown function (DUF3775)